MKNIIIASTSTVHGSDYLEYLLYDLKVFFKSVETILFIPMRDPAVFRTKRIPKKQKQPFLKLKSK